MGRRRLSNPSISTTFRCNADLAKRVDFQAYVRGLSVSKYIEEALSTFTTACEEVPGTAEEIKRAQEYVENLKNRKKYDQAIQEPQERSCEDSGAGNDN